ncbi:hypothetical protein CACET_c32010 [Clostridium aceticum]|uniref:Uncharacterized protein n=1 Tax=Clostridium aceticum TaxID=84022 RepID=A0A0D8IA05_9CLOT|nr:hypothetical protein [Clostridium aceticum]AKL96645.1 hypothetical protein CACET_c32010 [Clostridium aceticum]KJF26056.1 hypothetical protein TZ02_15130 [Clostridium aceticum]
MLDSDLLENYAALLIALRFGIDNPEAAFKILDKALDDPFYRRTKQRSVLQDKEKFCIVRKDITDEDIKKMIKLRGLKVTYKDIGAMYGLSDQATYARIKNYKLRMKEAT